jgi:hypothetical protein
MFWAIESSPVLSVYCVALAGTTIVLPAGTLFTSCRSVQLLPVGGLAHPPVSAVDPTVKVAADAEDAKKSATASAINPAARREVRDSRPVFARIRYAYGFVAR